MPEWQAERTRRLTQNVVEEAPALVMAIEPVAVAPAIRARTQGESRPSIDPALVEAARQQRIAEDRREKQRHKMTPAVYQQWSPVKIVKIANDVANFWILNRIPGYDLMKAHIALKHVSNANPGFYPLLEAVIRVLFLARENDPQDRPYAQIPAEESAPLFAGLTAVLVPYGDQLFRRMMRGDPYHRHLQQRIREDETAERRRRDEANRHAQFQEDLRERVVIFRRDPPGGVDLRAMANDHESVHRESVQTTTQRSITTILMRPIPEDQDTLTEILAALNNSAVVTWASEGQKQNVLHVLVQDYLDGVAFGVRYGDVMNHVWTFIRSHAHRNEIIFRLCQEVIDGLRTCMNGKMARLINALQGYDESLTMDPPRDVFQEQIARLSSRPVAERTAEVRRLFQEYRISHGQAKRAEKWKGPIAIALHQIIIHSHHVHLLALA